MFGGSNPFMLDASSEYKVPPFYNKVFLFLDDDGGLGGLGVAARQRLRPRGSGMLGNRLARLKGTAEPAETRSAWQGNTFHSGERRAATRNGSQRGTRGRRRRADASGPSPDPGSEGGRFNFGAAAFR